MSERIDEKVRAAVSARAKAAGYGLVFDIAARGAENKTVVIYSNDDNDLTQTVLELLNADEPKDTAKPSAKPDEKKEPKK